MAATLTEKTRAETMVERPRGEKPLPIDSVNSERSGRLIVALPALVTGGLLLSGSVIVALLGDSIAGRGGDALFRLFCHGLDERSLSLWGAMLPACARCTGIYAGLLLGGAAVIAFGIRRLRFMPVLILPLIADGLVQATGPWSSGNEWRLVTGILFGAGGLISLALIVRTKLLLNRTAA